MSFIDRPLFLWYNFNERTFGRGVMDKETIAQAAFKIISDVGLQGFSMSKLADELGCTKSSLYNHFKNKDDILEGVFIDLTQKISSSFEDVDDPIEAYRRYMTYCLSNVDIFIFFHTYARYIKLSDETTKLIGQEKGKIYEITKQVAESAGCAIKSQAIVDSLLLGPIYHTVFQARLRGGETKFTNEDIDDLINAALRSIRKDVK